MHASHLVWRLAATLLPGLGAAGVALGQTDTYLALENTLGCKIFRAIGQKCFT